MTERWFCGWCGAWYDETCPLHGRGEKVTDDNREVRYEPET